MMPPNLKESGKSASVRKTLLRRFVRILLLASLLWLLFILTGWALRKTALAQIAELTNTQVKAESLDFSLDGSVLIEGLVIRPQRQEEYDDAIFKAETVYAHFGIGSLLLLRPRLERITVEDFVFDVQHDLDTGRWNIAALKIEPPGGGAGRIPTIHLKRGTLQYSKVSKTVFKTVAAAPLDAVLEPAEEIPNGCVFNITTAKRTTFGRSELTGSWRPGTLIITGGISSADVGDFERAWTINVLAAQLKYDQSSNYELKMRIKDMRSKCSIARPGDPAAALVTAERAVAGKAYAETRASRSQAGDTDTFDSTALGEKFKAFSALQKFFNRYRPWGQIDIDLDAVGNLHRPSQSTLAGKVYCRDVSICDRGFAYPVQRLTGWIDFTEESVSLNNLSGRHGSVELSFNGWVRNFGPHRQYQFQITSSNLVLDDDLYNALSAKHKKLWSAFSPAGLAAINYCVSRPSQTEKKRSLAVKLLDVEATYRHLPYPLKNLTGTLLFDEDGVRVCDVVGFPKHEKNAPGGPVSQLNERKITLNGKVTDSGTERPTYDISIKAEGVAVDSTLAASLPAEESRLCRQIAQAALLHIESLTGRVWSQTETRQPAYRLSLHTRPFQLSDDLFNLLPKPLEKIALELQPAGDVTLDADLSKVGADNDLDYKVTVNCLGDSVNFKRFQYPLRNVTGKVTMTKNTLTIDNITALAADSISVTPNTSSIRINGRMTLADNAFSSARLGLDANDIVFDERLGTLLPESIRSYYGRLSPAGRFDLAFTELEISNTEANEKNIDFVGGIELKNCSFNTSPAITELNAKFRNIRGSYKVGDGFCNARFHLDAASTRVAGKSLTALKAADVTFNPTGRCLLDEDFTADCYKGRVAGKLELNRLPNATEEDRGQTSDFGLPTSDFRWEYLLQAAFHDIDLKRFLQDRGGSSLAARRSGHETRVTGGDEHTSGRMSGSLSVVGRLGDSHSRIGRCRLLITDMRLGKLSPMAKLLYVLKLTEPKNFAFDRLLVDSYIKHDGLFFQKLDLSGRALAFNGTGNMDLRNQELDLVLTARGRRLGFGPLATPQPSVLQSLGEGLGGGVVRMEVGGKLYDPQVTTTALPVIRESLQILGTEPLR